MYSSQVSENTFIRIHDLSDNSGSDRVNFDYLLDLSLKCKVFRKGHLNIQVISSGVY